MKAVEEKHLSLGRISQKTVASEKIKFLIEPPPTVTRYKKQEVLSWVAAGNELFQEVSKDECNLTSESGNIQTQSKTSM